MTDTRDEEPTTISPDHSAYQMLESLAAGGCCWLDYNEKTNQLTIDGPVEITPELGRLLMVLKKETGCQP